MVVLTDFSPNAAGDQLLEHGEGEYVVRQAKEDIVRAHGGNEMKLAAAKQELQ